MRKMSKSNKIISVYKLNSLFIKTFCFLTVFAFTIFFVFGIFVAKISSKNVIDANFSTHKSYIKQSANSVDLTLNNISITMNSTFFNKNIIPLVIAPYGQSYDNRVGLTRQLKDVVNSNSIINDAFVFVKLTDEIYSSKGEITTLKNFSERNIIEEYMKNPHINLFKTDKSYATDLHIMNNEIYMIQEFPPSLNECVGILVFKLNKNEIFNIAFDFADGGRDDVAVYSKSAVKIHDNITQGELGEYITTNISDEQGTFAYKSKEQGMITAFYAQSNILDWVFVLPARSEKFATAYSLTANGLLPFAAIFFGISTVVALFIAMRLYKPINKLMNEIVIGQGDEKFLSAKNELDYFNIAYNDIKSRQGFYDEMLANIAPSVLERIMKQCLRGENISIEKISAKLSSIPTKFSEQDRYIVAVMEIFIEENISDKHLDEDVFMLDATNYITRIMNNNLDYLLVRMSDTSVVLVLRFNPDEPVIKIKAITSEISDKIERDFEKTLPYSIKHKWGRVYNHIFDVHYSYKNALEQLLETPVSESYIVVENSSGEPISYYTTEYFISRIDHIEEILRSQNYTKAQELTLRTVNEVAENISDMDKIKSTCIMLVERLTGNLLKYKASMNDPLVISIPPIDSELSYCKTSRDVSVFIVAYCNEIILLFESYSNKVKHKYIIRAKEYIFENYQNSALSQQMVADFVGIHSSYLSRLFKENLGTNFLDSLNEYRLSKAKELLRNTDIPIKDIAGLTGFQSMSTFFRVFKKYDSLSPGQYRDKHNQKSQN